MTRKISSALISVYNKDGLEPILNVLNSNGVKIYSTGGTFDFIESLGIPVVSVDSITEFPEILGGRVKTLHPKIFGGILYRRENSDDKNTLGEFEIPSIDLVIVDLYPFEETVASGKSEAEIIEKIDIGGIALIRAASKNFKDVFIIPSRENYEESLSILENNKCQSSLEERRKFAAYGFGVSSNYDSAIHSYFIGHDDAGQNFRAKQSKSLRYGENPHQDAIFYGDLDEMFIQLSGKELSYNNLVDVDAAVRTISEFDEPTFVIMKHNNACGVASASTSKEAYIKALSCDPVSAFGGVIISNRNLNLETAKEMHRLFFEILIAPSYDKDALDLLSTKKDRRLLIQKEVKLPKRQFKTVLNGVLEQDKDESIESGKDFKVVTNRQPQESEIKAMEFALKICKHLKSNNVVLAKDGQLLGAGVGQTSRVDALKQAIDKAKLFNFDLNGAVMASEAFLPFPDCVEIAHKAGISSVVQPGGSIRDDLSIDYCNKNNMAMVFTGVRHFLH